MPGSQETTKESTLVIQEIESQLEKLLSKKKDEIDVELAERIREEEEAARARKEGVEREIGRERESLRDFQAMVAEAEEERRKVVGDIREGLARALDLQTQIDGLVKRTVEEIGKVGELQEKLESLRRRTSERAAFLKQHLRESFGIVAEPPGGEENRVEPAPDLDAELEKLKRIRTLLAGGSDEEGDDAGLSGPGPGEAWQARIPEIQDLLQASRPAVEAPPPEEGEEPEAADHADAAAVLDRLRRFEPVAGSGEISFFQQGTKSVLDAGRLLEAMGRAVEIAHKLTGKLEETESPRDRFFIKQELINGQEGLRNLVLRAATLGEKGAMSFPPMILDVLDARVLRTLFDRLSVGNWANAADLAAFADEAAALKAAFEERTAPPEPYLLSILEELGSAASVERPGLP